MNEIGKTKLPNSGEWWVRNYDGTIVFICGADPDGDPVFMDDDERLRNLMLRFFNQEYHHEPRCTGFDWLPVAEVWPKWIIADHWSDTAYVRRDSADSNSSYTIEGKKRETKDGKPSHAAASIDSLIANKTWRYATESEALARVVVDPVAEGWPKWYVRCETTISSKGKEIAYSKAIAQNIGETWHVDGSSYKWHYNVSDGWVECTESEALARVVVDPNDVPLNPVPGKVVATGTLTLTPVESPDDWVEYDPAQITCPRISIDWLTPRLGESHWGPALLVWSNATWAAQRENWKIRCLRRDMPVQPDDTAAIIAEHTQQVRELTQRIGDLCSQVNQRDAVIVKIRTALRQDFV